LASPPVPGRTVGGGPDQGLKSFCARVDDSHDSAHTIGMATRRQARKRKGPLPGHRAHLGAPGRPSKLTPALRKKLCGYIANGALLKDAAAACGVAEATVHEWIARGEGRDPDRAPTPEFERFAAQVRRAAALPMVIASNRLFRKKPDVWLARRDPGSWGPSGHARHGLPGPEGIE
jgi:hypothetical protein